MLKRNWVPRLQKNAALRARLSVGVFSVGETHPSGLDVPTLAMQVDMDKILQLLAFVVRGLVMFHWKEALDSAWHVHVAFLAPQESYIIKGFEFHMGKLRASAEQNLGRGTFVYNGAQSQVNTQRSIWQFTMFGEMQFGSDDSFPPHRISKITATAVTMPNRAENPALACPGVRDSLNFYG